MNFGELMNTPRPFTALAEWCACISYILMLRRRLKGLTLAASFAGMLGLFFSSPLNRRHTSAVLMVSRDDHRHPDDVLFHLCLLQDLPL